MGRAMQCAEAPQGARRRSEVRSVGGALPTVDRGLPFENRQDAGRRLADAISDLQFAHPVVLGLPRGGVPVAAEVARVLRAPLDVIIVRKVGLPIQPEVAMGAIAEDGTTVMDVLFLDRADVSLPEFERIAARERKHLAERITDIRSVHPPLDLAGCTAVIVDDGIATGETASVACLSARRRGASTVVVAAPVAGPRGVDRLEGADVVCCLFTPAGFECVGDYYLDFDQTPRMEVLRLLDELAVAHA
ncbi:phosphoribosyltransferase [Microbacterium sp. B2969]|uniref:Phosphoribosyltransferase n=1 Tax=Microbacterium alkaliflavum TaxID=3248839 RepID=A0ABW7Q5R3_9MICO